MAIARAGTAVLSNSGASAATTATATLASTHPGDYNIIVVSANTSGSTSPDPAQTCTGGSGTWATLATSEKSGSPSHRLTAFGKFYVSGDTAPTITIAASGNIENAAVAYSGVDTTTPVASGEAQAQAQSTSSTAFATPSITTAASRWLLSAAGDRTASTTWTGTDSLLLTGAAANAANLIVQDSNGTVAAGTYSRTLTASVATSVGNALIVALNPASTGTAASGTASLSLTASGGWTEPGTAALSLTASGAAAAPAAGSAVLNLTGAGGGPFASGTARLNLTAAAGAPTAAASGSAALNLTASGTARAPASGTASLTLTASAVTPIVRQLTTPGMIQYPAHRNGTYATYGEETLEGYQAAYAQYSKAILEISVWDTSDGVYVCSHDQTLSRVFGDSRTITSVTWSALSPNGTSTTGRPVTTVGGNPLRRLEEILDAFPAGLFIVENKHGTNEGTLATLLDSHASGRWMFKGPYNDTANALVAAGHGAPMWLYFYPSQLGSLSTTYSAVSGTGVPIVFGLGDFSTAPVPIQTDSDTFWSFVTSHGLMAWAHILGTTAQKSNADSQAAADGAAFNGYMTSSYPTLAPNDSGTGSANLTLTASSSAAATSGGAAALSLSASGGGNAAASGNAALDLTATGSAAAAGTGTASLTLAASGAGPSTSGTAALNLTGSASATAPAGGSATLALTAASGAAGQGSGQAGLNLAAGGSAASPASGIASMTFTASGTPGGSSPASGTAALALVASGTGYVPGAGAAALTFTASSTVAAAVGGSAQLQIGADGVPSAGVSGTAALTLIAVSAAAGMVGGSAVLTLGAGGTASASGGGQDIIFTAALAPQAHRFTAALGAQTHRFTATIGAQP